MLEPPFKKARMEKENKSDTINEGSSEQRNVSQDMFDSSMDEENDNDWSGVSISSIPCLSNNSTLPSQYPAPHPGPGHSVCVQLPLTSVLPRPFPHTLRDVWDGFHVRLPWSRENLYPVEDKDNRGKKMLRSRWELIIEALTKDKLSSSLDLEEAVLTYNSRYRGKPDWDFTALHSLFTEEFEPEETEMFFNSTLPSMVDLLISSPTILTSPLPLLSAGSSHSITLSQQQVSVILVNAFFCTFPRRNAKSGGSEFSSYPAINWNSLYGTCTRRPEAHMEKLKCLLSYFSRVTTSCPTGLITYSRKVVPARGVPDWVRSSNNLTKLHIASKGTIEVEGRGMLQADFANKFVGGGVLRSGLVQEEIRFTVCPELIASLLFTEVLGDREVLVVVGVEQFTEYEGYADSFKFTGRVKDTMELDSSGRKKTSVVAMDAIRFIDSDEQFKTRNIDRELNKAFVAFQNRHVARLQAVATGNWGCGAFGGDPRLKLLIQMMAAAEVGRDVVYLTFGDSSLVRDGGDMYTFLVREKVTVGEIYRLLGGFGKSGRELVGNELYSWIYQQVGSIREDVGEMVDAYEADTDSEKGGSADEKEKENKSGKEESTVDIVKPVVETDELTDSDKWMNDQMDDIHSEAITSTNMKEVKNGGFFAALDKMEKGELSSKIKAEVCPIEASLGLSSEGSTDRSSTSAANILKKDEASEETKSLKQTNGATSVSSTPTQSKLTDFFPAK
eukprot:GFUD01017159.1.p1 GENE.GFUD01017159.1~~GFUD01017159.1.p1  ORF type:complete len:729 (+),score=277.20 GFUD01017159.1:622-2808(+)